MTDRGKIKPRILAPARHSTTLRAIERAREIALLPTVPVVSSRGGVVADNLSVLPGRIDLAMDRPDSEIFLRPEGYSRPESSPQILPVKHKTKGKPRPFEAPAGKALFFCVVGG